MVVGGKRAVARLVGAIVGMMALVLFPAAAVAAPWGAQATLTAAPGSTGSGHVLIAPYAKPHGTFAAAVTINVHGASPNTTYTVTRYPDLTANGVCPRNLGPRPTGTLDTSAGGAGAAHFDLQLQSPTPFVSGTRFDVVWELVGSDGSVLVSECVTVTVK
jgi:hypothetical protein